MRRSMARQTGEGGERGLLFRLLGRANPTILRCAFVLLILRLAFGQGAAQSRALQASPEQSGTVTLDNSLASTSCLVHATIFSEKVGDRERVMILHASTTYSTKPDETRFSYTFNFDQRTISGSLSGSYHVEEESGGYDSSELFVEIAGGAISWDPVQSVWLFSGDVEMEVYLDMQNKVGSVGDQVDYGEAHLKTSVTGKISGASGAHVELDEHGSSVPYSDGTFRFDFEGKNLPGEGSGRISYLEVACYLEAPSGGSLESRFPAGPGENLAESQTGGSGNQAAGDAAGEPGGDFILSDPNDQLGLFIATYGADWEMLNQWPGWEGLSPTQQSNLIRLIQRLDTILALEAPVSPMGLALLEEEERQQILAQQAANRVEEELERRENLRDTVWVETLRERFGDKAVYLYQTYGIFQDIKSVYDSGVQWYERIKDPDAAIGDKLNEEILSALDAGKSPEDIAREAIENINKIATAPSVYHYGYYRQTYDQMIRDGLSEAEAHQAGMEALRNKVSEYAVADAENPNDQREQYLWGPGTNDLLGENGIYDRAFQRLNDGPAPQVTP